MTHLGLRPVRPGAILACACSALAASLLTHPAAADEGHGGAVVIQDVRPLDPSPGTSVRVTYETPSGKEPAFAIGGREAAVLHRGDGRTVLRVPLDTPVGFVRLSVGSGVHSEHVLLRVKPVQRRKLVRNILGGLALFLLGLRSIGQGLRRSVGPRDRGLLAGATGSPLRALGFGALMGGLSQSTTSAAAILIGMRQAHMVGSRASPWVIVGAYFGTVLTASLLPLAATREALLVIAFGAPLFLFSRRRRVRGIGAAVVGFGMLALGLRFIQSGFQPLIGDPELVVYVELLTGQGPLGALLSAAIGATLAAVLQGPGPVFALVLGIAQSSGIVGLDTALAVLAGAALGSSLGVAVLAIPYGQVARRLRSGFLWFGIVALLLQVFALPLWVHVADALVAGDPAKLAHGKKVLLPHMGPHLVAGFVVAQLAALSLFALGVRLFARAPAGRAAGPDATDAAAGDASIGPDLADVVDICARAVEASLEAARTQETVARSNAEDAVRESGELLAALTARLAVGNGESKHSAIEDDRRVASLAIAHMHMATATLADTAQRAVADNLELLPEIDEAATEMATLIAQGLTAASATLRGAAPEGIEAVQAREIRINAIESSIRKQLLARPRADTAEVFLGSQLLAVLEGVGNHLFRVSSALASTPDELL